jgi:Ca2+-binding EF-hand superfamily protein
MNNDHTHVAQQQPQDASDTGNSSSCWQNFDIDVLAERHKLTRHEVEELVLAFRGIDADGSGTLEVSEILDALRCAVQWLTRTCTHASASHTGARSSHRSAQMQLDGLELEQPGG